MALEAYEDVLGYDDTLDLDSICVADYLPIDDYVEYVRRYHAHEREQSGEVEELFF